MRSRTHRKLVRACGALVHVFLIAEMRGTPIQHYNLFYHSAAYLSSFRASNRSQDQRRTQMFVGTSQEITEKGEARSPKQ